MLRRRRSCCPAAGAAYDASVPYLPMGRLSFYLLLLHCK